MPAYKSRDVVELSRDPFGAKPQRTALIISSASRPREADRNDERTHTVTPLTRDTETFGEVSWAVVLDKHDATIGTPLAEDSIPEVWETLPVTDSVIESQITRITEEANKKVAKSHVRMILDDDT